MKSAEYWGKRAEWRMYSYMSEAERTADKIQSAYAQATEYINSQSERVLRQFQGLTGLPEGTARDMLKLVDEPDVVDKLKGMLKAAKERGLPVDSQLIARINSPAYAARLGRLGNLHADINGVCSGLYGTETKLDREHLTQLCRDAYDRTVYDTQVGTGYAFPFAEIPPERIKAIVNNPWNGSHFSERIWQDTVKLKEQLENELLVSTLTGRSYEKTAAALAERMGVRASYARRLVRTESCYAANAAEIDAYTECGIEQYEYLATLDGRTSPMCRALDGKVFDTKDAKPGVNLPPMHPYCRSTTVCHFAEDDYSDLGRRAKDPDTGKTATVPPGTTYETWKAGLVGDESDIGKAFKTVKTAVKDRINSVNYKDIDDFDEDFRNNFETGLQTADERVRKLLEKTAKKVKYQESNNRSRYLPLPNVVRINPKSPPSTLAHELFHEIYYSKGLSKKGFTKLLLADFDRLLNVSGGDVEEYLHKKYPVMFVKTKKGKIKAKSKYRGLADIINGLSNGKISIGYYHDVDYWKKKSALEHEAWAQFGRLMYENDSEAKNIFQDLLTGFFNEAILCL